MLRLPPPPTTWDVREASSSASVADACGGVIFSPSSWEPQEEGMMNIAARFSLSKKPKFIDPKGNKPND
jgi:hypothetical protein